jgi:hypothetical protein
MHKGDAGDVIGPDMSGKRRSRRFVSAWLQKKLIPAELEGVKATNDA